jgi:pimeloyl-ACP methyl ester carboxylesterase
MRRYQDRNFSWREAGNETSTQDCLVLLHGIGGSSASFNGCADHLTGPNRRLLAWDMPGYGATASLLKEMPDVDDYVSALWAFLDMRGIDRFDLAAHSLGSVIAGRVMETAPERVGRVVFICPLLGMAALPDDQRQRIFEERVAAVTSLGMRDFAHDRGGAIIGSAASPAIRTECIQIMSEVPVRAYLQAWAMLSGENLLNRITAWQRPLLIVSGQDDPVVPKAAINALHSAAHSQTQTIEIPGCGHFPMAETPAVFGSELGRFLST